MSVIIADMEMPEGCKIGAKEILMPWIRQEDNRAADCPLKSVDGMVEKIKEYNEFSMDEIDKLYMNDILKIIKEYCEMEGS